MVVRKRPKSKKMRGSRTHGHGIKKNRGKGKKGGVGWAGMQDHKLMKTLKGGKRLLSEGVKRGKYGHLGKVGFTRTKLKRVIPAINVRDLERIAELYGKREGNVYVLNLKELGIKKLLGAGEINLPVKVEVEHATEKAKEKVIAAGGEVIELA